MMPKSFDLNLLTVLDALIAERNVTRASQQLSRSQPAVSNALRRLRETFNDTLLVRGPNGMQLTPRAEALREPLREIVRVIDERILQEASFDPALAKGVCRISMPDRLTLAVVPPLMQRLTKMAPAMDLHVMTADRHHAIDLLEQDRVDVAVGWFDEKPRILHSEFLADEELYCIYRPTHPLARSRRKVDITAILSFPHLIVSATGERSAIFDGFLERYNLKRHAHVSVSHYTVVPHLLRHSNMIAVFTKLAADVLAQSYGLKKRRVPLPFGRITTNMIWHARSDRDSKQAWLRQQIKAAYHSV
jgi:LysR family transcriptional regulator, mexEF-oprN operon transcriptional activator